MILCLKLFIVSIHIRNKVNVKKKKKKKKKINSNNQINGNYYHFYLLFNLSPAIKYLIFKRVSRVLIKNDFGW